jgi:hypothetical protein
MGRGGWHTAVRCEGAWASAVVGRRDMAGSGLAAALAGAA